MEMYQSRQSQEPKYYLLEHNPERRAHSFKHGVLVRYYQRTK